MTEQLKKKVERAIRLIQAAGAKAKEHGQPLEICYSGGKDSDVILELARMSGADIRPIYKNTTIDPAGTLKHVRERGVEVMQPKMSFRQVVANRGMPSRWRRFCCEVLKEYNVLDYTVVGVRRDESRARKDRYKEPEICRVFNKTKCIKSRQYLPILDWSSDDVAVFLNEQGVRCHPLYYDDGGVFHPERRLGCMCCPLMSKKKRIAEFKRFPRMARFYIRGIKEYIATHPNGKMVQKTGGNAYDWFTSQVFCDGWSEFMERFGRSELFDDKIDTKKYLESEFGIEL